MKKGRHGEGASKKSPMRTFWIAIFASAAVLLVIAWLIGIYGLHAPVTNSEKASDLNIALWSLVITSVVALAGSITAVAIASAANRAQEHSTRLQEIDVYHNHPAYEKARRVSDAYISARSTLRLIVTGLDESRNHALAYSTSNARPMINRWRTFAADIHRSVFESELYSYLLIKNPDRSRLVAHSVAVLLSTADELEAIVAASKQPSAEADGAPPDSLARALFSRNAMAYVVSGQLLQLMSRVPTVEELFQEFGGGEAVPYARDPQNETLELGVDAGLEAIQALSSEAFVRVHRGLGLAATTCRDAAESLSRDLRDHYDVSTQNRTSDEDSVFSPRILVDLWLPFADQAIDRAIERSLASGTGAMGGHASAVASKAIRLSTLDQCVDFLDSSDCVPEEYRSKHALRILPPLLSDEGGLDQNVQQTLNAVAKGLAQRHHDTLFVFELRSELQQAETLYLASKLERCLVIWTGWPYVPNENVAFEALLQGREFRRAGLPGSSGAFGFNHPLIFTGALPFWGDPSEISRNHATEKLRDLGVCIDLVSDL